MLTNEIRKLSEEIKEKYISVRREIHKNPELGFTEFKTGAMIKHYLEGLGLEIRTNFAKTGVTAFLKAGESYNTIALRADMDALAITELNEIEYASSNKGVMHACGHDAHVAIVLGTAEILSRLKDKLDVNVLFIFQPAEEGLGGAKVMIDEGALQGFEVDAILAAHVSPALRTGQISVGTGPVMASPGEFEIHIKGKGGHAAQPHITVDPIVIGANLINLFQSIISREKNPVNSAVISVSCFNAGSAYNIIPDTAIMKGTVRTFDPLLDKRISERMEEITASLTRSMGAGYYFKYKPGYPPVINNKNVVEQLVRSSGKILANENIITDIEPVMLGEDFSYFCQLFPGAMFNLGCGNPDKGIIHNLHSCNFNIDEDCLQTGMELMSQWVADFSSIKRYKSR